MHASRALVGSLIVNGAILALLLAVAPRRLERVAPPALVDVAIASPLPPAPPPTTVVMPVVAPAVVAPHRARAAAPAFPVPTTTTSSPDDLAADSGSSAGGDGDSSGAATTSATVVLPPGPASTMPIPIGSHSAQLPYTRDALLAHTQGNVLVRVLVGIDGKVRDTTLVRGLGHGLDAIALALAAKLEFQPARDVRGEATPAQITWRFHFTPPPDAASL